MMKAPLEHCRVVELTHVWSGPLCGQVLADLGAEVIRVESRTRLDIHRRGGPYPEGRPGVNRSGTWNAQNRGKRSCTLDLKTAEGRQLLLDVVSRSDAVIENFTPGTLERLHVGFEALRECNPRIVLLSLSGYGQSGPYRDSLAYGPMMDAATGMSTATTYDDGIPRAVNGWAADVGGALYGCAALLRCLLDEERMARHIDVSQFEAGVMFLAEALLLTSDRPAKRHERGMSLVMPCAGDDVWIAVSARSREEVAALCSLVSGDELAARAVEALAMDDSKERRASLERAARRWCRTRSVDEALAAFREARVPASKITTVADLLADPALDERGAWIDVEHPEVGRMRSYGPAIRIDGVPPSRRAAPLLGGDNDYVFGELLGLPAERVRDLTQRKII